MARGFYSTLGGGTTDKIESASAFALPTEFTYLIRIYRRSTGPMTWNGIISRGSGYGDLFSEGTNLCVGYMLGDGVGFGRYRWTAPSTNTWANIGATLTAVDSGSWGALVYSAGKRLVLGGGLISSGSISALDQSSQLIGLGRSLQSGNSPFDGMLADFAMYNVALNDAEHMRFQNGESPLNIRPDALLLYLPLDNNPALNLGGNNELYTPTGTAYRDSPTFYNKRELSRVWISAFDSGTGLVTLVINDISQAQTIDNIDLTQQNTLAIQDTAQAQTIDNLDLTQAHNLVIADTAQAQTINNLNLVQSHNLEINGTAQSQTSDNIDLTQAHNLSIDDTAQSQTSDNLVLSVGGELTIADSSQSQTSDNINLTQAHNLVIAETTQSQSSDNLSLDQSSQLVIADTDQSQTSDNLILTQAHNLSVNNTTQAQSSDNLELTQAHVITIQDTSQAQAIENIALQFGTTLTVADISQSQSIENIGLTQAHILAIQDITQSMLLDGSINLLTEVTLVIADTLQSQLIDNVQWRQAITPIDRTYCVKYDNRVIIVIN